MTDKALAERLRKLAQAYRSVVVVDVTSINEATDLERAADLIESMAQRVPLSEEQVFADDGIMAANARIGIPLSEIMEIVRATESAHGIRSEE